MEKQMNNYCPACKHRDCELTEYPCRNCSVAQAQVNHFEPMDGEMRMKHGDRLRLSTDAELATFMCKLSHCDDCFVRNAGFSCEGGGCWHAMMAYLQSEEGGN